MSKIAVTGASGYIGSWVVSQLLSKGAEVVGTVRDPASDSVAHLRALAGAAERLTLVAATLDDKDAFVRAFAGCRGVLHIASPISVPNGGEDDFVGPAVQGNVNVLTAAKEVGIKRVVITSSTAAVCGAPGSKPADHVFSEDDWSDADNQRERKAWYPLSKTLAEKKAWELSKELGLEIVTLCPTFVSGPKLDAKDGGSASVVLKLLRGEMPIHNGSMSLVDVRDVAEAHINALDSDEANGQRYLLVATGLTWARIAEVLRAAAPDSKIQAAPHFDKPEEPSQFKLDKSIRLLGKEFITPAQSLTEMVADLRGKF